jgi:hypothetical protein
VYWAVSIRLVDDKMTFDSIALFCVGWQRQKKISFIAICEVEFSSFSPMIKVNLKQVKIPYPLQGQEREVKTFRRPALG